MIDEFICRRHCHPHMNDMIMTIYEVEMSGSDRDYNEWFCPRLRVHLESDGKAPVECPYFLEHFVQ